MKTQGAQRNRTLEANFRGEIQSYRQKMVCSMKLFRMPQILQNISAKDGRGASLKRS